MSVRKRSWRTAAGEERTAFVADVIDQHGKRHLKTFKLQKDARDYAASATINIKGRSFVADSDSATVAEAADIWLDAVRAGRDDDPAEASTLRQYSGHIRNHIVPYWGKTKLSQLSKDNVTAFRNKLLRDNSRAQARKVLTSFKSMLNEVQPAIAFNVTKSVRIGTGKKRQKHRVEKPDPDQVARLLATLDELANDSSPRVAKAWRRWRVLINTAIETGCRASELRGLPWRAINFKSGTIKIDQRADEKGVIGNPKSGAGNRTLVVSEPLMQMLREWKAEARHVGANDLVFATNRGRAEYLSAIYRQCWTPLQIKAGVSKRDADRKPLIGDDGEPVRYNFHAIRHFFASLLIADGARADEVKEAMGHSSITVTLDIYGSLFKDEETEKRHRDRAARLNAKLTGLRPAI